MLAICRTLFFIIILFCIIFLGRHFQSINISTDLNDLSPSLTQDTLTQSAINALSNDIESRFLLIVTGDNRQSLSEATDLLKEKIIALEGVSVDSPSMDNLLSELQAYRFQLLSSEQRKLITESSIEDLVQEAQRQLYRMDSSLQLLPVTEDPLGTFDHFVNDLMNKHFSSNNGIMFIEKAGKKHYFSSLALRLNANAMSIEKQKLLLAEIDKVGDIVANDFQSKLLRSGVFFFAADAAEKSEKDITFISTLSTTGIILLLLIVFRSIKILILPILSIAIGIVFAVGVSHYLYNSIHILTIVFGASLIGIIIDYSLHYFYHQQVTSTITHEKNRESKRKLFLALLLSVITSLVGYSALSFSSLEALKKVALFSCCGIFAAWLSVITIGSLSRINGMKTNDSLLSDILSIMNRGLSKLASVSNFPLWGTIFLIGAAVLGYTGLPTNDNPRLFFQPAHNLLSQETEANQYSQDFEPGRYLLIRGDNIAAIYRHYDVLKALIKNTVLDEGQPSPFFSVMDILPSPEQQQRDYALQEKIYQNNGVSENFFNQLGLPPEQAATLYNDYQAKDDLLLNPNVVFSKQNKLPPIWLSKEGTYIAFVLIRKNADAEKIERVISNQNPEVEHIQFINSLALSEKSLKQQRGSASLLLLLAYALIAALMLAYYRKLHALWVLLVPLSATLGALCLLALLGIDITLFHVMGLFLVLGLGMDYVIFIREMNEHDAVTQNAIFLSTLTTLFSFGLLSISSIPVAQAFGTTLLFGNTLNFLFSLFYAQLAKKEIQTL